MEAKVYFARELTRKIIRELSVAVVILVLSAWLVESTHLSDTEVLAKIPDITLRHVIAHLISAGITCGVYLVIKFRNEDMYDRQFLSDTLKWNDWYLKSFRPFSRILAGFFPVYLSVSVFVLLIRRITQLHRLHNFISEHAVNHTGSSDETGS